MARRPWYAGVVAGLLTAIAIATLSGASDGRPATGSQLYDRLTAAAEAGDTDALNYVAAIDRFMESRGIAPDDLAMPVPDRQPDFAQRGLVRLRVDDAAPWHVSVTNATTFDDADALLAYRTARHVALEALARENEAQPVDVVIAPEGAISIPELAAELACPCRTTQVVVDVFGPDGWLMSSGRDIGGRDLREDAAAIEADVLAQASESLDLFPGVRADQLRAEVRYARMTMAAGDAVASTTSEAVFAIDPLTDLARAFDGRAAIVSVGNGPDLREAHARLILEAPIDRDAVAVEGN